VGHHPIPHPGARISDDLAWRLFSPPIAIHTQALPTVQAARKKYLTPAVQSFAKQKKKAKIVMYLTWGYVRMRVCLSSWLCVCAVTNLRRPLIQCSFSIQEDCYHIIAFILLLLSAQSNS
jgi:hypothetical protein